MIYQSNNGQEMNERKIANLIVDWLVLLNISADFLEECLAIHELSCRDSLSHWGIKHSF